MSYEMVIEQIKLLEAEQSEMYVIKTAPKMKKIFFELAGKIHLESNSVTELHEASLL